MYCPKCGFKNPDEAKFCSACGSPLLISSTVETKLANNPVNVSEKPKTYHYAGFWARFLAMLIDSIFLTLAVFLVSLIMGGGLLLFSGDAESFMGFYYLVSFVLSWIYFASFESSAKQATLGKIALGIVVTDLNGNRISFGRASGRYFSKIISNLTFLIGYLMAAFTEKKQALHDMIAGTLVIYKNQ